MNFWENAGGSSSGGVGGGRKSGGESNDRQCYGDIMDRLASFGGKSEEQLMSELTSQARRLKAEGSFDPSALERLYATSYPFLDEAQRERMRALIDMLVK